MDIQFTKGVFYTFTAVKQVHLGAAELDVYVGDSFEYDGQTLRIGGREYNVPNVRAGIRAGWFAADDAVPRSASAAPRPPAPPARKVVQTVDDDERQVGFATTDARNRASNPTSKVQVDAPADGVTVGRVRVAAKQHTVLTDSSAVSQEINRLDNMTAKAIRVPVATGDVQDAMAGDDLEEILPDARSTGRPAAGRAGEGSDGADARARADEARRARLASMGVSAPATAPAPAPAPSDDGADDGADDGVDDGADDGAGDVGDLFGDLVSDADADADLAGVDAAKARMSLAKLAVPGFDWDLSAPWSSRVKAALAKREDPMYLNAILAVETDTVKKHIAKGLRG